MLYRSKPPFVPTFTDQSERVIKMPFYAINSYEEDLLDQAAQHTLELQLEQGLKIFEDALQAQKQRDFDRAEETYTSLFGLEVLQLKHQKRIPPSAFRLKSLALKNHALLLLDKLHASYGSLETKDQLFEALFPIVDNLVQALECNSSDTQTQEILAALAIEFGESRLARMCLESIVLCEDDRPVSVAEAAATGYALSGFSPRDMSFLSYLFAIVSKINDTYALESDFYQALAKVPPARPTRDYSWLNDKFDIKDGLKTLLDYYNSPQVECEVMLTTHHWSSILSGVEEALVVSNRKRRRAVADAYSYFDRPIVRLKFVAPYGDPRLLAPGASAGTADSEAETDVEMETVAPLPASPTPEVEAPNASVTEVTTEDSSMADISQTELLRSSRRVKAQAPENTVAADFGLQDRIFSDQIVSYLELTKTPFKSVVPIYLNEVSGDEADMPYEDFKKILTEWDEEKISVFLRTGVPDISDSQPIMQLLDFAALGTATEVAHAPYEVDAKQVGAFLADIENGDHIQRVRLNLLCSLIATLSDGTFVPKILTEFWPSDLLDATWRLVKDMDDKLFALSRGKRSVDLAEVILVIYEMCVDRYMTLEREMRSKSDTSKDLTQKESELNATVLRWRGAAGDLLFLLKDTSDRVCAMKIRHQWVSIFYDQVHSDAPELSMTKFEEIRDLLAKKLPDLTIEYSSFDNIPTLSHTGAETQISKYRAASIFAKVFSRGGEDDIAQSISLLEAMLMPEIYTTKIPEYVSISQFLSSASNDFRLNLWYLLLENYEQVGEKRKSLEGLVRILDSSLSEVGGVEYLNEQPHKRQTILLQTLSVSHDVARRLLPLLMENEDILHETPIDDARKMLALVVKLVQLLHIFMLNDQAINSNIIQAPQAFSWERGTQKFRELAVYWWCIFYLYYRAALPEASRKPEVLNDILSIIHEQLGVQGYCSLADGSLLKLNIKEIVRMDWPESEADMMQCLHCRYGLSLFNEYFQPYNHHSVTEEMAQEDAVSMCRFVTKMLLSKKNLTQFLIRAEIRQAIDVLNEALGTPDPKLNQIRINTEVLDRYLDHTNISAALLKSGWTGQLSLSMQLCNDPKARAAGMGGIYFVMGLVTLIQFRMRKRANAARVEDLYDAIKYFRGDLICSPDRFESWFGLSQAYDYLAEESLIRSAEALTVGTALFNDIILNRGRALLSCTMALSSMLQGSSPPLSVEYAKVVGSQIWSHYGRLLLYSASSPHEMAIYGKRSPQKYIFVNNEYKDAEMKPLPERIVLRLAYSSLMVAKTTTPRDWFTWYIMAKTAHRLGFAPRLVLDQFAQAVYLRANGDRDSRNQDIPAVATQSLLSLASYYALHGQLDADNAIEYFAKTSTVSKQTIVDAKAKLAEGTPPKDVISNLTIQCFTNLIASDKRHWLHRPYYWLAKHYDEVLGDKAEAEKVFREMFSRGSTSKIPLNIWTSEYERPGQHFVYVHDYIVYYSDLLFSNGMESALNNLARRLRRFNLGMTDHLNAWRHICTLAVQLALKILGFPARYSDRILPHLEWTEFEFRGQQLEKWVAAQVDAPELDPWILALEYALDFRRLNNGYGATAQVDELVISIYLRIMELHSTAPDPAEQPAVVEPSSVMPETKLSSPDAVTTGPAAPNTPSRAGEKKRRVIRRDVQQQCQHMLKPLQARLAKLDQRIVPRELHKYAATMTPEPIQPVLESPSKSPLVKLEPTSAAVSGDDNTSAAAASTTPGSPNGVGPRLVPISLFANRPGPPPND